MSIPPKFRQPFQHAKPAGIAVEVMPGATIEIESANPMECTDPSRAVMILALNAHLRKINSIDDLHLSMLSVIDYLIDRVQRLESAAVLVAAMPEYEHADFVRRRLLHVTTAAEEMRAATRQLEEKRAAERAAEEEAASRFDRKKD